jgi:hypothetical protein
LTAFKSWRGPLAGLLREGKIKAAEVKKAITDLGINSDKADPFSV